MKPNANRLQDKNYRPEYVPQVLKVIAGQSAEGERLHAARNNEQDRVSGSKCAVDLMTLIQLPVRNLASTVRFYVDVLGLHLDYPERPLEHNSFVSTVPRIGPGLHFLVTPEAEFRHLHHHNSNENRHEYAAFYTQSLQELHKRLLQAGALIVKEPSNGSMSFLDPEGHLIGVYERTDSAVNETFQTNITGFRHVRMLVSDAGRTADFFEQALGFESVPSLDSQLEERVIRVREGSQNQPFIHLLQVRVEDVQPMHWMLDGRPKHALELHSQDIRTLRDRIVQHGGRVEEELEFTGCGGYLKFYTPDGHYIWVNQDRRYCDY